MIQGAHYPNIRYNPCGNYRHHRRLNVPIDRLLSFDYVRETLQITDNPLIRVGKKKKPIFGEQHGPIIGYAVVGRHMPYLFNVLIWWHKHHDRDVQPEGPYQLSPEHRNDPYWKRWGPCEAVSPARVLEFFPELQEGC